MTPTPPVTGVGLVARTVALDAPVDLVDVAGDHGVLFEGGDGSGFAGWGSADRMSVRLGDGSAGEAVAARLRAIAWDDSRPPIAMGALPFSPAQAGWLVVPAVLVRREVDGSCWLTVIASDPAPSVVEDLRRRIMALPPPRQGSGPRDFRVRSTMERNAWRHVVAEAAKTVAAGALAKVVLAREVTVVADRALRCAEVVRRLRSAHPACSVFSIDGFVGASPELLVERRAERVRSQPLAGTVPRGGRPGGEDDLTRLLSSTKEREEHRLVVDAVSGALASYCDELAVPEVPGLVPVGNLAHLGTLITGHLRDAAPTVVHLVDAVHPSPAVGGSPTDAALRYQAEVEQLDRGRYAGPVGWVDAQGDGCFAVGIRSAQIEGCRARLVAGAGVVAGSDPDAELAETELKLQPMLAAIVRP